MVRESLDLVEHRHADTADIGGDVRLVAAHDQVIPRQQCLRHVVKVKEDVFTRLSAYQKAVVLAIVKEFELATEHASLDSMRHLKLALLLHVFGRVCISMRTLASMTALLECHVGSRSLTISIVVLLIFDKEIELHLSIVSTVFD